MRKETKRILTITNANQTLYEQQSIHRLLLFGDIQFQPFNVKY